MRGLILAAGLGTRLIPLTLFRPKPAIPFLNRPLIQYSLELLTQAGVQDIAVNLHHLQGTLVETLSVLTMDIPEERRPHLTFSPEEQILGTAGAIDRLRRYFSGQTIVICNGKIYFEEDLKSAIAFHEQTRAAATLVLVPQRGSDEFSPVFMDEDHNITRFGQKGEAGPAYAFTGVHVLSPEVLDFIPEGRSDTVKDLYPRLIQKGYPVRGFISDAYWCECSTARRYLQKSMEVLNRRGLANSIESGVMNARCHNVIAGRLARADQSCVIENCILWDRVRIGRNSSLRNVIISDDVDLLPETHLTDAVVTPLPQDITPEIAAKGWIGSNHLIWPL